MVVKNISKKNIDWKETHKKEIVEFVNKFYRNAYDWRDSSFHANWDKYERNYNNIYDPNILSKKESWQSTMFIPSTVTNVETIVAAMVKLLLGKQKALFVNPREMGDELQAELHSKILDYEVEAAQFCIAAHDAIKDACIFGSGFIKIIWEKANVKNRIKKQVKYGFMDGLNNFKAPGSIKGEVEEVVTIPSVNRPRAIWIPIRDIFLEPNSMDLQRLIHRTKITYCELLNLPKIDETSLTDLLTVKEPDNFEDDVAPIKADLDIEESDLVRTDYDKQHTLWEYWGIIPRKWIDLNMPENTPEEKKKANELVQGKFLIASKNWFLCSEENPTPLMEAPFIKLDYIRCGQTYGKGVAQLMEGLQEEINEIRNCRIDNVNLIMNKIFVGVEKNMVDMKDVISRPGQFIRLKGSDIDDVKKVIAELPISDVPLSAFRETVELERQIQEATAANRVTIGSASGARDTNQTLGGMELLRQSAYDRFAVYAYMMAKESFRKAAKLMMSLSYQNRTDEEIQRILGIMPVEILPGIIIAKFQAYKKVPIHELERDYDFSFVDIFGQDNKAMKAQSLTNFMQLVNTILPSVDNKPALKRLGKLNDLSSEEVNEMLQEVQGTMPTAMGQGMGIPSITKPTKQSTGEVAPPEASPMGL